MRNRLDFNEVKIDSLEKAKAYFVYMHGNGFHMCREYPERYEEFQKLSIPEDVINAWSRDLMRAAVAEATNSETPQDVAENSFRKLLPQVRRLKSNEAFQSLCQAVDAMIDRAPGTGLFTAADIIAAGQPAEHRAGIIYSIDSDHGDLAAQLCEK